MKIAIFSSFDIEGGAARAAHRLHRGLVEIGLDSTFYTQRRTSDDCTVIGPRSAIEKALAIARPKIDALPLKMYRKRAAGEFTFGYLTDRTFKIVRNEVDLLHLNWVSNGFISVGAIGTVVKPMVWTLHDMWAFTGGCHYDDDCGRYREHCGACPSLGSNGQRDLSSWTLERKRRAWAGTNLTVVAPSRWLAECAKSSSLFRSRRVEVIPYGLDLSTYKPLDKGACREILGVGKNKKLVLFGAIGATTDRRKGFQYLQPAIRSLANDGFGSDMSLLVFGASQDSGRPDLGMPVHYVGRQHDDISMNVLYAAADVMVVPSKQDNLPNTVLESMACATPVVAFNVNGMPDMVEHRESGYLAQPFDAGDLARGISWVLAEKERWRSLSQKALEKVQREYSLPLIARRYEALYSELISDSRG